MTAFLHKWGGTIALALALYTILHLGLTGKLG